MRTWSLRALCRFLLLALNTLHVLAAAASAALKSRAALQLENLALRHHLGVLHRSVKRPKLTPPDRVLWVMAVRSMERLAIGSGHRQTGHRDCLAPQELPSVLDMEGSARATGAALGPERGSRPDR